MNFNQLTQQINTLHKELKSYAASAVNDTGQKETGKLRFNGLVCSYGLTRVE